MFSCLKLKKHEKNQKFSTENGGVLLEELIAFCNGRSNPIRHFSAEELLRATNYYDTSRMVVWDSGYQLYKGSLKERPIFVKKNITDSFCLQIRSVYKDIVIGSQMSAHKNVLKVIGCCLETRIPSVVYEFTGEKSLSKCISGTNGDSDSVLPWKCRLRIAVEIGNAVAYLHTAFSRPVIHRDIRCSNIMLDHNNVPKLTDFGLCIPIPQGQSHVEDAVVVRSWIIALEYAVTGYLTEKVDVYSFGILLLELVSGRKPHYEILECTDERHFVEIVSNVVDPRISIEAEQLMVLAKLIHRCICDDGERRPAIIEATKELKQILHSLA